jgi:chromosome partitioning protein
LFLERIIFRNLKIKLGVKMIISFANQKGGVGKTTLSLSAAFEMSKKYNVLMIDADPQSTLDNWLGVRDRPLPKNLSLESIRSAYQKQSSRKPYQWDASKFLQTFMNTLEDRHKDFDYVIVDTPPRLTDITRGALGVSNMVIIPCQPSGFDAWATHETIDLLKQRPKENGPIKIMVMINMKLTNSVIGKSLREYLSEIDGDFYLGKSEITSRTVFAKAASLGLAIQEGDREKKATKEVEVFVKELIKFGGIK